jgi:hypothetical protein
VTTRRRRLVARVALAFAGVALALVAGEIVCRIDALFPGRKYSSAGALAWFTARAEAGSTQELDRFVAEESKATARSKRSFMHPFQGWTDPAALGQLRGETTWYADAAKSDSTFDVLILGASVAGLFGNFETKHLVAALQEHPHLAGREVRVWNDGMAAYKAPQPLHLLEWAIAVGHRPDAVVLIDGFNEVAIAAGNVHAHVHPLYPYAEFWGPMVRGREVDVASLDGLIAMRIAQREEASIARTALARGFHRSALLTRIPWARLAERRTAFEVVRDEYLAHVASDPTDPLIHGPPFQGGANEAVEVAVRSWSESARAFHALCVEHGIVEVHVLQPTLADAGATVATAEEVAASAGDVIWSAAVVHGYPGLRAAAAELSAQGVLIDDATRIFEHEEGSIFLDVCHFNERGNDLLRDFVLAAMRPRLR